jgi:hypothetical protein
MWDVYWVGVFLGIGLGLGVGLAGVTSGARNGVIAAAIVGAAIGVGLGLLLGGVEDGVAGGVGSLLGALGTQGLLRGTLRRGGTRIAAGALLVGMGLVLAVLAFIPLLGFLEAAALPTLALRMRRREPARYAGLRTLARD